MTPEKKEESVEVVVINLKEVMNWRNGVRLRKKALVDTYEILVLKYNK